MAGTDPDVRLSDGEWRLMHATWAAAERGAGTATVRQVLGVLEGESGWAYSTVKTMLERLAAKGALARQRRGLAVQYRPLLRREDAQRRELAVFTAGVFEGRPEPLVHFLFRSERLSEADRRALRRLVERAGLRPDEPGREAP